MLAIIFLTKMAVACNGTDTSTNTTASRPQNISIFIDLSDRIVSPNADQVQKDTLIVGEIASYFTDTTKFDSQQGSIMGSKNKLRVIFNPAPSNEIITDAADRLLLDLEPMGKDKKKRDAVINARTHFTAALAQVYKNAAEYGAKKSWPGSDIWGFFNNGVVDQQCVKKGYRNILVIVTDGEIFYSPVNKESNGTPNYVSAELLANPKGKLLVERNANDQMKDLEVMILELNPRDPKQLPRMKQVLEDWLVEMGVKQENITLYQTDTPANTRTVIRKFLKAE